MNQISIRGAHEHNLKDVNLDIPKNALVVFTGVSGSGKSSLVFDTIYAEAFRRFADASHIPVYLMGKGAWSKLSRPKFRSITGLPPALGLPQKQGVASKNSTVGTISGITDLLRVYFAAFGEIFCKNCHLPLKPLDFQTILQKINSEFQKQFLTFIAPIAHKRKGGFRDEIEKFRQLGFSKVRVNSHLYSLQDHKENIQIDPKKLNTIEVLIDHIEIVESKKSRIQRAMLQAMEHGKGVIRVESKESSREYNTNSSCPQCGESATQLDPRHFSHSSIGRCPTCLGSGSSAEDLPNDLFPCSTCQGTRLCTTNPIVYLAGKKFEEIQSMSIEQLLQFLTQSLVIDVGTDKAKLKIYDEALRITRSVLAVGLNHLILNRAGFSLSPGDLQRLKLATMISNNINGALYVADEPCQGLTAAEVHRVISVFKSLIANGSSVFAVEHHPTFLSQCDMLITMGPGAGIHGGRVISTQSPKPHQSIQETKAFSSRSHEAKERKQDALVFSSLQLRQIKKETISILSGAINIIRGPTGSGKSSFVDLCLIPALQHLGAKNIDHEETNAIPFQTYCQLRLIGKPSPQLFSYSKPGSLTRNRRRSVASTLEILQPIRALFAQLPSSQALGLSASHFSWNSKLGQCAECEGKGYKELPQKYSQPIKFECDVCLGSRLTARSLIPRFKGANLADIMGMTLEQAFILFENQRTIASRIQRACQFGLSYIQLGQGTDSLSGGELQRLMLILELKRAQLEGFWFTLMHPSTGLHKPDIVTLGHLMQEMTQRKATFILVENREEFQDFADQIIEM